MAETIFALSSGAGRAGIAVVRVSGRQAGAALQRLTGRDLPAPRQAVLRRLCDREGSILDRALVLWFPGPGSVTGEDLAEFHLHGSRAVVAGVLTALAAMPGFRLAEPGEFTRRAFENGRMDLTEVEGLADLIDAETEAQRRQAFRQMEGGLSGRAEEWRDRLVRALALIEAEIDFSDEELPECLGAEAEDLLRGVAGEIGTALQSSSRGELVREGVHVAILGAPNAGKSSLLNRLAQRDVAIVSDVSGTTRDVLEVRLDLGGVPVVLADTAGIRDTADPVEAEGVARARARAAAADIALWVVDLTDPAFAGKPDGALVIGNKSDIGASSPVACDLRVSAQSGAGFSDLESLLGERAEALTGRGEPSLVTRARQVAALSECFEALGRAIAGTEAALVAEDVRLALRGLGRLAGRVDVEEILDVIFRDFCIGK